MKAQHAQMWLDQARLSVAETQTHMFSGKGDPQWDSASLLSVMWNQWNAVFRKTLGQAERTLVSELRDVRNRWAHQKPFSSDDAYRALDSAGRLLTAVSAPQAEEVEKIKMELLRVRFDEQVRSEKRKTAGTAIESEATGGDDARKIGKLGGRALVLVLSMLLVASVFAIAVASPLFARLNIDKSVVARLNESTAAHEIGQASAPSFAQWFSDLVPSNAFKAAAEGALLPLVVVSVAFGLALTRIERQRRASVVQFFHGIADAFLILVSYVVEFAPIGVFALAVPLAARMGVGAVGALAFYVATLSAVLLAFMVMILLPAAMLWGRLPLSRLVKAAAPAQSIAFASRSSLAALPAVYEGARDVLALPEDICDFFLPLAASIFRVGAITTQVVGLLFLAKLYGLVLNPWQLATISVTAVATSLTVPGVPGGGIIVMAPLLTAVNLPAAGIGILLAVNPIPDSFSTTANVTGWLCAGTMLSRGAVARSKESVAQSAVVASNHERI